MKIHSRRIANWLVERARELTGGTDPIQEDHDSGYSWACWKIGPLSYQVRQEGYGENRHTLEMGPLFVTLTTDGDGPIGGNVYLF